MAVAVRSDEDIKMDVVDQLYWDDRVNAADIRVEVRDGAITLTGSVPTYSARKAADDARLIRRAAFVYNQPEATQAGAMSGNGKLMPATAIRFKRCSFCRGSAIILREVKS